MAEDTLVDQSGPWVDFQSKPWEDYSVPLNNLTPPSERPIPDTPELKAELIRLRSQGAKLSPRSEALAGPHIDWSQSGESPFGAVPFDLGASRTTIPQLSPEALRAIRPPIGSLLSALSPKIEQFYQGLEQSEAGMVNQALTPKGMAELPLYFVPYLGQSLMLARGAEAIGSGLGTIAGAPTAENIGRGTAQIGAGALGTYFGARGVGELPAPFVNRGDLYTGPLPPTKPATPTPEPGAPLSLTDATRFYAAPSEVPSPIGPQPMAAPIADVRDVVAPGSQLTEFMRDAQALSTLQERQMADRLSKARQPQEIVDIGGVQVPLSLVEQIRANLEARRLLPAPQIEAASQAVTSPRIAESVYPQVGKQAESVVKAPGGQVSFAGEGIPSARQAATYPKSGSEQEMLMRGQFVPAKEKGPESAIQELRTEDVVKEPSPGDLQKVEQEVRGGAGEEGSARTEAGKKGISIKLGKRPEEGSILPLFGALTPESLAKVTGFAQKTKVAGQQLLNRLRNVLGGERSAEWALVRQPLEGFLKEARSPEEVAGFLQENGPRVEVQTLGKLGTDPESLEYGRLTHEFYDRLPPTLRHTYDRVLSGSWRLESWLQQAAGSGYAPDRLMETATRYQQLHSTLHYRADVHANRTHWQSVAPKAESEMPGYAEIAVVVPNENRIIHIKLPNSNILESRTSDVKGAEQLAKEKGGEIVRNTPDEVNQQFPSSHSFPPNTLGWSRGYMETLPNGKKVWHVVEVQSDWGQRRRDIEANARSAGLEEEMTRETAAKPYGGVPSHPLLREYQRLVLKATIKHAIENGADAIAVSDAETAMMTEGHDLAVHDREHVTTLEIPQENGMRLNYDTILPKMLQELTGQKGEKVEFGEHKMAFMTGEDAQGRMVNPETGERNPQVPRQNLIFKTPTGEPKTTITANAYDLSKVNPKDFTLTGTDRSKGLQIKPSEKTSESGGPGFTQAIVDKLEGIYDDIRNYGKKLGTEGTISQLYDASENAARLLGKTVGERTRIGLRQGKQTLGQKIAGNVPSMDDRALVYAIEADGGQSLAKMRAFEQQVKSNARELQAVRYGISNWSRLAPHAQAATRLIEERRQWEVANGVDAGQHENYIKHAYEEEGRNILFDPGRGGTGITTGFKKQRTFATYADAVEAGLTPRNVGASVLMESRVTSGARLVNRLKWAEALSSFKDPVTGNPVTAPLVQQQPKGTWVVPKGYEAREILPGVRVGVSKTFANLIDTLLSSSFVRRYAVGRALLEAEGTIKHGLLLFDTYHASRMMQKQLFLTGKVGWNKGLSLIDYDRPTVQRLVSSGDLPASALQHWDANKPTMELLVKNGLNVGRIAEAISVKLTRSVKPVFGVDVNVPGRFNKWVFDKVTRGAMAQAALSEYARVRSAFSKLSDVEVARKVAKDINTYFGNLQHQGLLKGASERDVAQLALLAPWWLESMATTELKAMGQAVKVPIDAATQRTIRIGTLARGVGAGLLAYFAATQLVNLYFRKHSTLQNKEEGHKLDAWIPDPTGKTPGYWISPFSVPMELTHDVIRYSHSKQNLLQVAKQIASNKMSPLLRTEETLRLQEDFQGNKLLGPAEVAKQAGKSLLPLPLPVSGITSDYPGQGLRQALGSTGLKVEPMLKREAEAAPLRQRALASRFEAKESTTLQQRYDIAQKAEEHSFNRQKQLFDGLSRENRDYLAEKKLQVRDAEPQISFGRNKAKLNEAEMKDFLQVVGVEYNRTIDLVRARGIERQKQVDTLLEHARTRAVAQFRRSHQQ